MTSKRRKTHKPEHIVAKPREADVMLNVGKDLATVLQALEISEATLARWRAQYGGVKSEEPAGAPRASADCLDSPWVAHVDAGSLGGGAGRAHSAAVAGHPRLTVRRSYTQKTTWEPGC